MKKNQNFSKKQNKREEKPVETQTDSGQEEQVVEEPEVKISDPFPEKQTLRFNEVANFWNVTERTVRLWVDHGHLVAIQTPGGQRRITKESFDKCIFAPKK